MPRSDRNAAGIGTGTGPPAAQIAAPQAPEWIPLPADHAKYLDDVLGFWEHHSSQIERYRCRFKRWEYDPDWVGDANVFKTFAEGAINYAAPDKGLFRVENSSQVVLPLTQGQTPQYTSNDESLNEHWICDGTSTYEFDGHNKQLIQRELPPEMRGKQIVEGPLPFMFGAKSQSIKDRYWIRVIVPPPKKEAYWLEAVPKTRDDAANFKMAHIVIAEKDFLPEGIVLYHRNKTKTTFAFEQRESNWSELIEKMNVFHRQFFQPKTPTGWKKIVQKYAEQGAVPVSAPPAPAMQQTQRPSTAVSR